MDANSADYANNLLIIYVFFAMIVRTIQPPVSATTDFLRLLLSNARCNMLSTVRTTVFSHHEYRLNTPLDLD